MQAYIKANGTLVIVSENETEQFALDQWMKATVRNEVVWTVATGENESRLTGRIERQARTAGDTFGMAPMRKTA